MRQRVNRLAGALDEAWLASVAAVRPRASRLAVALVEFLLAPPTAGLILLYCAIAVAIAGLPLTRAPEYYLSTMLHDTLFIADLGYRMASGQVPSVDFAGPFGVAFVALVAAGVKTGATVGEWLRNASWIALACALPAILYVAKTRLSNGAALLFTGISVLTLVVPVVIGNAPDLVTYAMLYNRVSYVLLLIVLVIVFGEASPAVTRGTADAALAALIAVALLYTKANYGVFAFFLLFVWGAFYGRWIALGHSLIVLVLCALLLEVLVRPGFHLAYLGDLQMAAEAGGRVRVWYLQQYLATVVSGSMTEIALGFVVVPAVCLRLGVLGARDVLALAVTLLIGLLLIAQNAQHEGLYVILAPALILLSRWRSGERRELLRTSAADDRLWIAVLVVAVFCLAAPYLRTPAQASLAQLAGMTAGPRYVTRVTDIERLQGLVLAADGNPALLRSAAAGEADAFDVFRSLRQRPQPTQQLGQDEYLDAIRDGLAILQNCPRDLGIVTLDFANPFPMLRGSPAIAGIAGFHNRRTFSERAFPAADRLFGGVDCVMVPKLPVNEETLKAVLRIYGGYLGENYPRRHESTFWTLLRR